jgi:hypothetical protein
VKLFKEAAELRRTVAALRDEIARLREGRAVGVLRWIPQSRTLQRLRAMQEYLADRNFNADFRLSAMEFSGGEKARVVDDARPAVHAQGFLGTGNEEDEADIRVGDNVLDRVEVIVARSIGNEQGLVVEDLHKAGRSPRGETSALPAAFAVPRHKNGERLINARMNRSSFRHRFCTAAPSGRG